MSTPQPPDPSESTPNFPARLRKPVSRSTESGKGFALAMIFVVGFIIVALAIAANASGSSGGSRRDDSGWNDCLVEQQARIAREGSLLTAEDFCSISYPDHD